MVLYVNANLPVKTFDEFIALLRKNPGKYSYASPGSGSTHQLLTEMMKIEFGLQAEHIPYKAPGRPSRTLIAGHVALRVRGHQRHRAARRGGQGEGACHHRRGALERLGPRCRR
ncbi:tricarboxylate binding receptor [Alicycliphilus sp. B1]|nr:tricarboxylate binding receptor [Alicycliphilus sp. B1]